MTEVVLIGLGGAVVIVALALALPCPACEKRRERLKAAYEAWRKTGAH